eukprot:TRINITY_DN13375_c0_g2_i1.p1 TRINITY_DN13375_c0_g2~~TRINITY_DN13375_c0_g2_i1.p1  ORF type:complete len:439 (+),score=132.14 TRINITY_DN13375_c0_g2_i1:67-1383(+)
MCIRDRRRVHGDEYSAFVGPECVTSCFENFKMLLSLLGCRKVILEQGIESLANQLRGFRTGGKTGKGAKSGNVSAARKKILESEDFKYLERSAGDIQVAQESHPKLEKLQEIVRSYFALAETIEEKSKAIVFTNNRASAREIHAFLAGLEGVRSAIFVGQNSANPAHRGLTQREQIEILEKFRNGHYNLLVATCIGEEGLDIGEVDLIVCYDSGFSPIRMVQRMGRTGRKREGRVIFLLMEGKEHHQFIASMKKNDLLKRYLKDQSSTTTKSQVFSVLRKKAYKNLSFYSFNPRMLPDEVTPSLRFIYQPNMTYMSDESEGEEEEDGNGEVIVIKDEDSRGVKMEEDRPCVKKEEREASVKREDVKAEAEVKMEDEDAELIDFEMIDRLVEEYTKSQSVKQEDIPKPSKREPPKRKDPNPFSCDPPSRSKRSKMNLDK